MANYYTEPERNSDLSPQNVSSPASSALPNIGRPSYCPFCGVPIEKNEVSCRNCGWAIQEVYSYEFYPSMGMVSEADKERGVMLSCRNAWLTDTEFHYCNSSGQISSMVMACVHKNSSLAIQFNNGKTEEFRLAPDDAAMDSATIKAWGKGGGIMAAVRTLNDNVKEKSVEWAAAINMLISKKNHETINCYRCWTENKSTEPQCLHCGAIL